MQDMLSAFGLAWDLLSSADADLMEIVGLSLHVSLSALLVSCLIGFPLGAAVAITRFRGRTGAIILMNALMGLLADLLMETIAKEDAAAADRLRHKMLTTLHTLEANTIRSLIDSGIAMIGQQYSDQKFDEFAKELSAACQDMEEKLTDFMQRS